MTWALRLPRDSARALGPLRRFHAVGVCESHHGLWLRGQTLDESLAGLLRLVPGGQQFNVGEDRQLTAAGDLVPKGYLPEGPWQLLDEWLHVALPEGADVLVAASPIELVLVPSGSVREPALLETNLVQLAEYLAIAPQWRIDRWSFVADHTGRAIIRGLPLPPLPGTYWTERDGIATPAGYDWSPAVDPAVVRQVLGLTAGEIALLHPGGTWDRVLPDDWTRASRSAVRKTSEATSP